MVLVLLHKVFYPAKASVIAFVKAYTDLYFPRAKTLLEVYDTFLYVRYGRGSYLLQFSQSQRRTFRDNKYTDKCHINTSL